MNTLTNRDAILAQLSAALHGVRETEVQQLETLVLNAHTVFCYGLGRSGLAARSLAMRLMHLGIPCAIVGDTLCPPIGQGDLLLLTSASGGSQALRSAAEKAKRLGGNVALVTANRTSALADLSDVSVLIQAPSKDDLGEARASVLPMGSLFEEASFILFDMVVADLMDALDMSNDRMVARHANLE